MPFCRFSNITRQAGERRRKYTTCIPKKNLSRLHSWHGLVLRVRVRGSGHVGVPLPSFGRSAVVSKVWTERDQTVFIDNDLSPTPEGCRLSILFVHIRQRLKIDTKYDKPRADEI